MMKHIVMTLGLLAGAFFTVRAQDTASARGLTMAEYEKTKSFSPADLDKDSYVKYENAYILDRNDFGKPYFITGDDGLKKRIDLYKLIRKEGRAEIGTVIFYTTETGHRYMACMPGFKADGKVWEKYFEDIHAIDREEKNFVLKLSYVLSRELGFQLYRAGSGGQSSAHTRESGTYGNDICFPGSTLVSMADGRQQSLSTVRPGDDIVTVDPVTHTATPVKVKELTVHEAKNYAITSLLLIKTSGEGRDIRLSERSLQATPNHPILTTAGEKRAKELIIGDQIATPGGVFTVWNKEESAGGMQKVYNIVTAGGVTYIMDGIMVLQKPLKN